MKKYFSGLITCLFACVCMAQTISRDTITIVQIPAIIAGEGGHACLWDFSMMKDSVTHDVYVIRDSLHPQIREVRKPNAKYMYCKEQDTLYRTGYENTTTMMRFPTPIACMRVPLTYGDSLSGSFIGEGEYGRLLPITMEGTYTSYVDGEGTLVLPYQRFDSVSRVCLSMDITKHIFDTTQFHINEYLWFHRNHPYPLLEATEVTSYISEDTTHHCFSFYAVIEEEEQIRKIDEFELAEDIPLTSDSRLAFTNGRFLPNPVTTSLLVSYTLTRTATIWFSLHSSSGIPMYRSSPIVQEDGDWQFTIPMAGLPMDDYVLYIHVDDLVLAETIIKL